MRRWRVVDSRLGHEGETVDRGWRTLLLAHIRSHPPDVIS